MKKTIKQLTDEYAKKYLPNNDKLKYLEYHEILNLAQEAQEAGTNPEDFAFYLVKLSFEAGFMKGYHCAEYDRRKKDSK